MFIVGFSWKLVDRLAFPAIMLFVRCFRPCVECSVLIYLDVRTDLVRGDACSILLRTIRSEITGSLSSSIAMANGRVLVVCHFSFFVGFRDGRT